MTVSKQPAPFRDPYNELSDDEFEAEVLRALEQSTEKISLRMPSDLLQRTRRAAQSRGVPYQSLIKVLVDQGIRRLERPHGTGRTSTSAPRSGSSSLASKPSIDSQFDSQSRRTMPDKGGQPRTKSGRAQIRGVRRRTSTDAPGPV
jgi:CopG antitoxin of type II toxin-antitoxin system